MIFKIAFNVVAGTMFIGLIYFQLKLLSTALRLRERRRDLFKNVWSDFGVVRRIKKAVPATEDGNVKQLMLDYLRFRRIQFVILIAGFLLLMLIGYTNSALNGTS